MDRDELAGMSRQIAYDFEMVEALAKRLMDWQTGRPGAMWADRFPTPATFDPAWFEWNAVLEACMLHARALTDFLYESPPASSRKRHKASKDRDRFAEHWF